MLRIGAGLRAAVALGAVLCALGAPAGVFAAVIEGQVFDEEGKALSNQELVIVERKSEALFAELESPGGPELEVLRGRTDKGGFYRLDLGARTFHGAVFVRVEPSAGWDGVRYAVPADYKIKRILGQDAVIVVNIKVEDAACWKELTREIARSGGAGSKRGKILRRHGFPREVLTRLEGITEWRFPGVTYVFKGDELIEARRDADAAKISQARGVE